MPLRRRAGPHPDERVITMRVFPRKTPKFKQRNPADGREYDEVHVPNSCYGQLFSVFWTGKSLDYDATNAGHEPGRPGRLIFTDGSWADSFTGEHRNAGRGDLAVSRIARDGQPW